MEPFLVRFGSARSASALVALGLTAAAALVAIGPTAPAGTSAEADRGSTGLQRSMDGGDVRGAAADVAVPRQVDGGDLDREQLELERSALAALTAERNVADARAGEASVLLESVKAVRQGAVEHATRDAEREGIETASPRELGQLLAAERGFTGGEWSCLDSLWQRESNWNPNAENPSSGAYGIPQSLPGSKMATVADDWRTNPATQITWGLDYITDRYGSPCGAWSHSESVNWY